VEFVEGPVEQIDFGSVDVGCASAWPNRADVEQGASEDMGNRVRDGVHLGRPRVEEQRHPHHDRAEIERPGRGGGDNCQGKRGPVVGT